VDRKSPNPQAFPRPMVINEQGEARLYEVCEESQDGMELRDYFAIKALNGMLASPPLTDRTKVDKKKWARIAYEWADAMLAARVLIVVMALALGACSLKSAQITHAGMQSADLGSTYYAEARGGVEGNPVMRVNLPTRIVFKAAATGAVIWLSNELEQAGRPKLARGLLYTLNTLLSFVVVNNVMVAQ
jgi:hypothetical protein